MEGDNIIQLKINLLNPNGLEPKFGDQSLYTILYNMPIIYYNGSPVMYYVILAYYISI